MSSTQPGAYQSNLLRYAVRQTRAWIDRSKIALRRLQNTAAWAAQILLYPVYVAVQTVRLAGAVVKQAIALEMAETLVTTEPDAEGANDPVFSNSPTPILTADTPIHHALQLVQGLPLATNLPVVVVPSVAPLVVATPPTRGEIVIKTAAKLVKTVRSWLKPAHPSPSLPLPVAPLTDATHYIQAIASLVETRSLVLVTNQNQLLDILTAEQQTQLRQRIAWETAHYGRYLRLRQDTRKTFARFSAKSASTNVIPPVRLMQQSFQAALAWVQTSPLAVTTNLFQEAALVVSAIGGQTPAAALPEAAITETVEVSRSQFLPGWNPVALLRDGLGATSNIEPAAPSVLSMFTTTPQLNAEPELVLEAGGASITAAEFTFDQLLAWDCIETEAVPVGYVLKPLDRMLRWVDRALLWLENGLIQGWQWLRQRSWVVNLERIFWEEEWRLHLWQWVQKILRR